MFNLKTDIESLNHSLKYNGKAEYITADSKLHIADIILFKKMGSNFVYVNATERTT